MSNIKDHRSNVTEYAMAGTAGGKWESSWYGDTMRTRSSDAIGKRSCENL